VACAYRQPCSVCARCHRQPSWSGAVHCDARRRAGKASNSACLEAQVHDDGLSVVHPKQAVELCNAGLGRWESRLVGPAGHERVEGAGSAWRITKAASGSSWSKVAAPTLLAIVTC
jgi:hypothetical protein